MRNKTKSYKHLPPTPPFFPGWTALPISLPPPPEEHRGMGNGGYSQLITCCLCRSFLLTLCPCSGVVFPPWETVLHELLQRESFPRAAALHKLPQRGFLPRGAVLQEQVAPAWVPHRVTSPVSKPALAWAPLSMGPPPPAWGFPFLNMLSQRRYHHRWLAWPWPAMRLS